MGGILTKGMRQSRSLRRRKGEGVTGRVMAMVLGQSNEVATATGDVVLFYWKIISEPIGVPLVGNPCDVTTH